MPLQPGPLWDRHHPGAPGTGGAGRGLPPRARRYGRLESPPLRRRRAHRVGPPRDSADRSAMGLGGAALSCARLRNGRAGPERLPARFAAGARGAGLMRLFAAVPLPEAGRSECAEVLAAARATGWPVRWVRDDLAHLTLKFFGEVAPERLDVIAEAVEAGARGCGAMTLRLEQLGAFPSVRRPRILWLGFRPEGVPFRPHVTLGRVREGQRLPHGARENSGMAARGNAFMADSVVLYESRLTANGPEYTPRLTLSLGN